MKKEIKINDNSIVQNEKIENIFSSAFSRYAKYIIQDRALPDVRDGLKPVQRRIIYAMYTLQMFHDKPHKKSARTVGEVIGKYHPHGDTSIYDAMVVMSQQWKKNIPLIDMHGNNGSIDNDACAAMRYTEARLSLYAECLINNIKKETVPFIENFDGGEMEPTILPALLPNLLINGSSGIAAGYATNIPPFNIIELLDCLIKKIDKPDASLETFLKILPGPDFPTGGIILNKKGVVDAYETGKGKINIRGEINLLNKKQAYITSIPYEVNKAELIDEINECASKYDTLGISECHDETDQKGISICINLKNSDNYELMKKFLLKHTQLQISYNFNMICIKDRKPCLIGLLSYFDTFLTYCEEIVLKYTKFDLNKAEKQKEIITGLIKAISILEDVIKLIRKSKDKADAMIQLETKYKFTKNQSESIVNLRLYRLSNTDVVALKNELEELEVQIKEYTSIINDQKYRNDYIKNIFKEYKKTFKDCKRKSMFSDEESEVEIDLSETIEDKEVFFVCTRDGYLKNVSMKSFENNTYEEIGLKESDIQVSQFLSNQKNKVVLVTNKGNFITIPVYKINQTKWKENGVHINSISAIETNEKILKAFEINPTNQEQTIVLATKKGYVKQIYIKDLNTKIIKTSKVINLLEEDELVCAIINDTNNENTMIGFLTTNCNGLRYPISQIPVIGKNATGVRIGKTSNDISSIFIDYPNKKYLSIICSQGIKKIDKESVFIGKRSSVPKPLINITKANSINVLHAYLTNNNDKLVVLYENNKLDYLLIKEITKSTAKEKLDIHYNNHVVYCNLIDSSEEVEEEKAVNLFD